MGSVSGEVGVLDSGGSHLRPNIDLVYLVVQAKSAAKKSDFRQNLLNGFQNLAILCRHTVLLFDETPCNEVRFQI